MRRREQANSYESIRKSLTALTLALAPLLVSHAAEARPAEIKPPPGAVPEQGQAPATGQPAPSDPQNPPEMPAPQDLQCAPGGEAAVCDPQHPGNEEGQQPNNTPGDAWFKDMATQMFELQESLKGLSNWSQGRAPYIEYYTQWLLAMTQQYYALGFYPSGVPRTYSYGRMTRADFNYYFYYWLRPVYYNLLYSSANYYSFHRGGPDYYIYQKSLYDVAHNYHDLVACNYGFNADDKGAREDMEAGKSEAKAGVRLRR